jgi:hypothetical protein
VDWRVPPREEQNPEMRAVMDEIVRLDHTADLREFTRAQLSQDSADGGECAVRHTAAAITAVVVIFVVLGDLTQLVPGTVGRHIAACLPANAGDPDHVRPPAGG